MNAATAKAEWQKRYEPDDEGLRFIELTYTGNYPDLPPVTDGILGDRMIKERMTTNVMEKQKKADVLKDEFTIAELNDLNNYMAWNTWDVLVMRATEGASGMIPRQEYEALALMQMFYRYPELMRAMTKEVGAQGVLDIGASARTEIGTKVNCVHDWCIGTAAFSLGRCVLLALEAIEARDYVEESNAMCKFAQRVQWGKRQDGWTLNSQNRYRCQIHDQDLIDQLTTQCEDFEPESDKHNQFVAFNAAAELLAFFDHYDCRLGLGDTGPYLLPDGRILIIRDLFVNEEIFHWSDVCEGLPYCYTLAVLVDPDRMGLKEIRVNDISTTFTIPKNYISAITGGTVLVREKWDTPMSEVYHLPFKDFDPHLEKIREATFRMYQKTARMSRRELILNGVYTYFIDFILPHLRKSGIYDYACQELNLWEIDQRVTNYYYDIMKRNFLQETVPLKVFSGSGYLPFPEGADLRASKYFWR